MLSSAMCLVGTVIALLTLYFDFIVCSKTLQYRRTRAISRVRKIADEWAEFGASTEGKEPIWPTDQ